jgi:osmotically-inducible protein OsmY
MAAREDVLAAVRAALAGEPRVALYHRSIRIDLADDVLTLDGEVPGVAGKKLALERAAAVPGVGGIVDRLRVTPAQPMGDREIRDHLRDAFLQEPALAELTLKRRSGDTSELVREPPETGRGWIELGVEDGVVTLNGEVPGLGHKRLAGVLAWWVPGSRDVINGVAESPTETDNDEEITDAVRIALEKDPFVNAGQIRVSTADCVVTLRGLVPTESEKEMAEADAWYVFGVDGVVNELAVKA